MFASVASNDRKSNGALYATLAGPRQRFIDELDDEDQAASRTDLDGFGRVYSFRSQIVEWTDTDREKLYVFARSLLPDLPTPEGDGGLDLGSDVELTHLRIEVRGTVDAAIADDDTPPLDRFPAAGAPAAAPRLNGCRHRRPPQRQVRIPAHHHRRFAVRTVPRRLGRKRSFAARSRAV